MGQQTAAPRSLSGHWDGLGACAYSPDGRLLASGASQGELTLCDAETCEAVATLTGHKGVVQDCAYTPDGRRIASASFDRTIRVWDAGTGLEVSRFFVGSTVLALALGLGGRRLAARNTGGTLHVLRLMGFEFGILTTTAAYIYRFDSGQWDAEATAGCTWCGRRFISPAPVLDTIRGIHREVWLPPDDSPCESLPTEAWDERRRLSEGPHCTRPVRFNPFIVDNRERY